MFRILHQFADEFEWKMDEPWGSCILNFGAELLMFWKLNKEYFVLYSLYIRLLKVAVVYGIVLGLNFAAVH